MTMTPLTPCQNKTFAKARRSPRSVAAAVLFTSALLLLSFFAGSLVAPRAAQAADDAPILTLDPGGPTAGVMALTFTAKGRLVSVGMDKVIRVWDPENGKQKQTLRTQITTGLEGVLYAVAADGKGETVAVGGYDGPNKGIIRLFSLTTGQIIRTFRTGPVYGLAFSPVDDTTLASAGADGTIRLWNVSAGRETAVFKEHKASVMAIAFSPDGQRLASASYDGTVRVWKVGGGSKALSVATGDKPVLTVAWSPDGASVIAGGMGHAIRFLDPATGKDQRDPLKQDGTVLAIAVSRVNGGRLVAGTGAWLGDTLTGINPEAKAYAFAGKELTPQGRPVERHAQTVKAVAFSLDGKMAASADLAGKIHVWDPETGDELQTLQGTGSVVARVGWSVDSNRIGWMNQLGDGSAPPAAMPRYTFRLVREVATVFDRNKNKEVKSELPAGIVSTEPVENATWMDTVRSLNGRVLKVTPDQKSIMIEENGKTRTLKHEAWESDETITAYAWTTQGDILVGTLFRLCLYDASGKLLTRFVGHQDRIMDVAAAPNGMFFASASADQTVRIWPLTRSTGGAPAAFRSVNTSGGTVPLLSIFLGSDDEWVASSPQGFYTSSPQGDRLIGWQVNKGEEVAAEFYTADQFETQYFRPRVIASLFEAGSMQIALQKVSALEKAERLKLEASNVPVVPTIRPGGNQVATNTPNKKPVVDTTPNTPVTPGVVAPRPSTTQPPIKPGTIGGPVAPKPGTPPKPVDVPKPVVTPKPIDTPRPVVNTPPTPAVVVTPKPPVVVPPPTQIVSVEKVVQVDRIVQIKPPTVVVNYPLDGQVVDTSQITLRAKVTDPNNRKYDVQVRLNARPPDTLKDFKKTSTGELARQNPGATDNNFERPVVLQPGDNYIQLWAENDAGTRSRIIEIKVVYRDAAARPEVVRPGGGKRIRQRGTAYVLAIGVGDYNDPDNKLEFPAKDAKDFVSAWKKLEGKSFKKVVPTLLCDKDASQGAILDAFDALNNRIEKKQYGPDDTVVVFLSGHGFPVNGNYYFAPPEFDPEKANRTGVQWSTMISTLGRLPCKVILALDTCHAGQVSDGGTLYNAALKQSSGSSTGLIVFASCLPDQKSEENREWQNGAFTKAFVEGLDGKAADDEGLVDIEGLASYVQKAVKKMTENKQKPYYNRLDNNEDFDLAVIALR